WPKEAKLVASNAELLGAHPRGGGNAARMACRVRVPRVDRGRQRLESCRRALDHRVVGLLERGGLANDDVPRLLEPEHRVLREENEEQRRETERRQRDAVGPEGSDRHGHEREDELEREVLPVEQTRLARR